MRAKRLTGLTVESMESRALLTAVHGLDMPRTDPPIIAPSPTSQLDLHLKFRGKYTVPAHTPDTSGDAVVLQGTTQSGRYGTVTVGGTISGPGNIAQGSATGQLIISTKSGHLVLDVHGPTQPGFGVLPTHFRFTIRSATGSFHNDSGNFGTLSLTLTPGQNLNSLPHGHSGHFSLQVDSTHGLVL